MYPHERSLVRQLAGKPFALIGVNGDSDRDVPKRLAEENVVTWRSFWNGPQGSVGPITEAWEVVGWPTIYIIDAGGTIRYKNVRGDQLNEALETLLGEMGHDIDLEIDDERVISEPAGGR